jgi:hypothetical protein
MVGRPVAGLVVSEGLVAQGPDDLTEVSVAESGLFSL